MGILDEAFAGLANAEKNLRLSFEMMTSSTGMTALTVGSMTSGVSQAPLL